MVYKLDTKGVNVTVLDPKDNHLNPDAVFPNNWFSIHKDKTKVLYPMFAKSRRKERDLEIFNSLAIFEMLLSDASKISLRPLSFLRVFTSLESILATTFSSRSIAILFFNVRDDLLLIT